MYQDLRKCLVVKYEEVFYSSGSEIVSLRNLVSRLPRTSSSCEVIWVMVDRLTKHAYFIPVRMDYLMERLAKWCIEKIVCCMIFHSSIRMTSFEALYDRKCVTFLY